MSCNGVLGIGFEILVLSSGLPEWPTLEIHGYNDRCIHRSKEESERSIVSKRCMMRRGLKRFPHRSISLLSRQFDAFYCITLVSPRNMTYYSDYR